MERGERDPNRAGICFRRYPGQKIIVDGKILIRVNAVEGGRVLLYVEAPRSVKIERPPKEQDKSDRIRRVDLRVKPHS